MNPTYAYVGLAIAVVGVIYRLTRTCSHEYSRPWGPRHNRTEECLKCGHSRPHIAPQGDRTPVLTQLDVDGSDGAPGAVILPNDRDCAKYADIRERAIARYELARKPSSEQIQ